MARLVAGLLLGWLIGTDAALAQQDLQANFRPASRT